MLIYFDYIGWWEKRLSIDHVSVFTTKCYTTCIAKLDVYSVIKIQGDAKLLLVFFKESSLNYRPEKYLKVLVAISLTSAGLCLVSDSCS